jgi:hypothetical protein
MIGRPRGSSWKIRAERYSSQHHVAHDVERPAQMLGQKAGVEDGVLLAGRRVLLGADALKGLRYTQSVHVGGPLEEHVLHQVGDPRNLVPLVAAAGPDPDPKRDARGLFEGLREHPQAPH